MPERTTTSTATRSGDETRFTKEERDAMKERAKELRAAKRGKAQGKDLEQDVLDKIAEMPDSDRKLAERIHQVIKKTAPDLAPKLWYGMPAYALDGKVLCFFQAADKFKSRYATFGFNDVAVLDDGSMWPTSFALTKLTKANEAIIADLVTKAVS